MGDAHFTAVPISKVSASTIAGNVEKGDGNHGMLGKNVGIIKLWLSNLKLVEFVMVFLSAKVGPIPFRWWRCLGRLPLTIPGMHGVWLAARRLCGRGLRVLHLIIAWPGWNDDAPRSWFHRCPQIVQRSFPKEKTKHVVVIREHRWPIIHQDHLASTEHYNQIQAALHRSEVKTWRRFMNLMNPLLLGTSVHALL